MITATQGILVFWLAAVLLLGAHALAASDPWLLIDTQARILKVMRGDQPLDTFKNLALGRNGAGLKRRRGDKKTPIGVFRIGWMNVNSRYDFFIGLDYPNLSYAKQAYEDKRIDIVDYYHIRRAIRKGRIPPQDTPLGGFIGIHGVGEGDPWIHANFNWTNGCVALRNPQMWRLGRWVQIGTRVEIR